MSAPTPAAPAVSQPTTPPSVSGWGAPAVSIFALAIFAGSIALAVVVKSPSLDILLGAAAANATTVIGFWVGSSAGSQKKDAAAQALAAAAAPAAPAPAAPAAGGA
jgi:hypothetical protein